MKWKRADGIEGKTKVDDGGGPQAPQDATFSLLGVASRLVRKKDKNDNPFWDISVMDGTGQIDGKIWGSSEW